MAYAERLALFNNRSDYKKESARLLQLMNPALDGPILDVGCGVGGMFNTIRENGFNPYGIDVGIYISRLKGANVAQADGETIPFQDHLFSAVYYMHSLAHIQNPRRSLGEAHRVLKPGGNVFIVTPNERFERLIKPVKGFLEFTGRFETDKTVIKHYSPGELKSLMSEYFDVVYLSTFGKLGFQRVIANGKSKAF